MKRRKKESRFFFVYYRDDLDEKRNMRGMKGVFLHSGWYMINHEQFARVDEAIYI